MQFALDTPIQQTIPVVRLSEGVYQTQPYQLTLADRYFVQVSGITQANSRYISSTNTLVAGVLPSFDVTPTNAVRATLTGVDIDITANQTQTNARVRTYDEYGNLTNVPTITTLNFSNATDATMGIRSSTGTMSLTRTGFGVYDVDGTRLWFAGAYTLAAPELATTTGGRFFDVRPDVVQSATFSDVVSSIPVGGVLPAFTVTFRDKYLNLVNHTGTVMFRDVSNATVMGSISTSPTGLGVVTAQTHTMTSVGDFTLSVSGIAAGNIMGNKRFVVVPTPTNNNNINPCNSIFLADSQLTLDIAERRRDFEDYLSEFAMDLSNNDSDNAPYIIPVVVHIVQSPGMPNITNANIERQLAVLNQDFNRQNPDRINTPMRFLNDAASANIRFCLAQTDPSGNVTNGIIRYNSTQGNWQVLQIEDGYDIDPNMKRLAGGWDPSRYLNIWIVDFSGFLGFARFPWQNRKLSDNTVIDGVTMDFRSFGTLDAYLRPNFALGRILSHEIGHWLGLYHTWGDAECGTDLIDDTPVQRFNTRDLRSRIDPFGPTCLDPNTVYFSDDGNSCNFLGIGRDARGNMFMNYMDYNNDACVNMFTRGQVLRMRRTLLASVNERDIWWREGNRREMIMNSSSCFLPPFQVFLSSDDNFSPTGRTITCNATARNGVGPYTFEWQYRSLEVGSTQWTTLWSVVPNNNSPTFTIMIPDVQSLQIRVTAIDANGQRVTTSIIIRNQSNSRLPNRRVALTTARTIAPSTIATLSVGLQTAPNPASDEINIFYTLSEPLTVTVEVLNILNQVLFTPINSVVQTEGKQQAKINITSLQSGTYFVRCTSITSIGKLGRETIPIQVVR